MEKIVESIGCVKKKMIRKEVFMFKKYVGLSLVLLLLTPSIVEAKSMFEENFEREQKELKSGGQAVGLSLAATGMPLILGGTLLFGDSEELGLSIGFGSIVLGPSIGHFYAGQTGRGIQGIAIRSGIVAGATGLGYWVTRDSHPDVRGFTVMCYILLGGLLSGVHGLYDICTTPSSVRKYNESLMEENSLRLVPEVDPFNESYGLSIVYNF